MLFIFACLLSLSVAYSLLHRRNPEALGAWAWMGLREAGREQWVAVPVFALGAYGAKNGTLLVTVGGFMESDSPSSALLAAGILGGVLAMIYVWRRGSMIPALLLGKWLAGATTGRAMGMNLP